MNTIVKQVALLGWAWQGVNTNAGEGWLTPAMLAMRDMLAASSHFQAWTDSGDAAEALGHIFPVEVPATNSPSGDEGSNPDVVLFPCVVVTQDDAAWRSDLDSAGSNNAFFHHGALGVRFMRVAANSVVVMSSRRAEEIAFSSEVGAILKDVEQISGSPGRLDIDGIMKRSGPGFTEPDDREDGRTLIGVDYEVSWRG